MNFIERMKLKQEKLKEREIARLRRVRAREKARAEKAIAKLGLKPRKPPRRPPEAGLAVPAVPPKGPLPMQGGAAASLDFD